MISQATMSIGAVVLMVAVFFAYQGELKLASALLKTDSNIRLYLKTSAVLCMAVVVSLLVAKIDPVSFSGVSVQVELKDVLKLWYFVFPLFIFLGLKKLDQYQRKKILLTWLFAATILGGIGVLQYFTGWPRAQALLFSEPTRYHATLFIGHHLSVASILIFPFFVLLDLGLKKNKKYFLAALLVLMTLFLTFSRMLWISLPIGILIWMFFSLPKKVFSYSFVLLLLLGGVALFQDSVQRHIGNKDFAETIWNISVGNRIILWKANLELFQERPITGVGFRKPESIVAYYFKEKYPDQDLFVGHSHNVIIESLSATGLLGFITTLAWIVLLFVFFRKTAKSSHQIIGYSLFAAWIVFQLNGFTQVNFWEGKVMHQMMWVLGGTLFLLSESKKDV